MVLTIVGAILGSLIAAIITITIEVLRKPHLKILSISPVDFTLSNQPARQVRSIRVKLVNKKLPDWIKWMYRNPALQCHGNITFYHLDGQNVFGRAMTLRWTRSPEPNPLLIQIGNSQGLIFDPVRITQMQKMDIYPGESADIDIAAKFDNESECYGWSNESYFSDPLWRPSNWRLGQGRYLIKVCVLSSGHSISSTFRLVNDVDQTSFRLENTLPKDIVID